MTEAPMIVIERGIRSGYGVFADGRLAVASPTAEGAVAGVAGILDVNLIQLLRTDMKVQSKAEEAVAVRVAASAVASFMRDIDNPIEKINGMKINGIRAIRGATGCGLKDCKDALEEALQKGL